MLPCGRFVWTMNLDPVLDWNLIDGAVHCLQSVLPLACSAARPFVTLTRLIARHLDRTPRAMQNYRSRTAENGVIACTFNRKMGIGDRHRDEGPCAAASEACVLAAAALAEGAT